MSPTGQPVATPTHATSPPAVTLIPPRRIARGCAQGHHQTHKGDLHIRRPGCTQDNAELLQPNRATAERNLTTHNLRPVAVAPLRIVPGRHGRPEDPGHGNGKGALPTVRPQWAEWPHRGQRAWLVRSHGVDVRVAVSSWSSFEIPPLTRSRRECGRGNAPGVAGGATV